MGEILERMMMIALSMVLLTTLFPIINNMGLEFQINSIDEQSYSMMSIDNDIEEFKLKLDSFLATNKDYENVSFTFGGPINVIITETISNSLMIIFRFSNTSLNYPVYKTVNLQENISISVLRIEIRYYSIISENTSDFIYFY